LEVNPESTESTETPFGMGKPIWMIKFGAWSNLQKNCPAKRGPGGIYCSWEGRNCSYTGCPRRIFEEEMIDTSKMPVPKPQPKLKNRISVLEQENIKLMKRVEELEKKNVLTA